MIIPSAESEAALLSCRFTASETETAKTRCRVATDGSCGAVLMLVTAARSGDDKAELPPSGNMYDAPGVSYDEAASASVRSSESGLYVVSSVWGTPALHVITEMHEAVATSVVMVTAAVAEELAGSGVSAAYADGGAYSSLSITSSVADEDYASI